MAKANRFAYLDNGFTKSEGNKGNIRTTQTEYV